MSMEKQRLSMERKERGFWGIHVCLCVIILSRVCVDSCVGCALRILSAPHIFPELNLQFLDRLEY